MFEYDVLNQLLSDFIYKGYSPELAGEDSITMSPPPKCEYMITIQ
jgi:hypothetical protein